MGTPKSLLEYQGETFLARLIRIFETVESDVVVVLGRDAKAIQSGIRRQARFVINSEWELGQLSSLQCGLAAIAEDVDAVFFTPVDFPSIHPQTPKALIDNLDLSNRDSSTRFVIPRFEGRRGHPVLFDAGLKDEFLSLPRDAAARDVVHRYVPSTRYVDVNDPGILRDIDEPADYSALVGARVR
jgi:molybdenum cofactor cytidylyltransferase